MSEGEYKVGYKKPPRGKPFEKGNCLNPKGRPKLPQELLDARKVSKQSFEEKLQTYLRMPMVDLEMKMEGYRKSGEVCLDMLVGSIIVKAIMEGCISRMNFLLNRMGVNSEFAEHDPTLNMLGDQQASEDAAPYYVVELNRGGKFLRSRPREVLLEERKTLEEETKTANG